MRLTTIKLRDGLFFHVHDAFDPQQHPHAPGGTSKGGQFTKGSGGGTSTKTKIARKTKGKPVRAERGKREEGFQAAEKAGKTFTLPGGAKLPPHIANIAIPPAWTNVRYNPDPKGELLVCGTDKKGKRQPRYSAKYEAGQAAAKFKRIQLLEPKFDAILAKNEALTKSSDPKTSDIASALSLIIHTGLRPGSEVDTGAEKQAYGATTLKGEHVTTDKDGNTVLRFIGKSGKDLTIPVTDPAIAKNLQERAKKSGPDQQIFPNAQARHLLDHVKKLGGASFKTKDFRTLLGTRIANQTISDMPVPKSASEYKKFAVAVAKKVSETLGNTPAVALESYISPHVFADWRLAAGV